MMKKYLAILRGINVGGHRKILMADLKDLFSDLGYTDIQTYIQSGNVIFGVSQDKSESQLAGEIAEGITKKYGYDVPVIVRSATSFIKDADANPFIKDPNYDIGRLHWTILNEIPNEEYIDQMDTWPLNQDEIHIVGNNVFLQCEGKYSQTKLTNQWIEKKLKVSATTRNWKTVVKLISMMSQ
ncbi:DUF1697 domain-containing protein [Membranihabitans marinus]|uniref:DUF1697 domain-containing protein n=1 Tax=Membranihabitans marinus TaxID=1227546 RepID=UPI001F23199C|nr:DUF1697 domain-containing protein [Membranihabitans marinus]